MAMDGVRMAMRRMADKTRTLSTEMDASTMKIRLLAEDLEKHHSSDMVNKLEAATIEMIECADFLKHHSGALQFITESYQPGPQLTDFVSLLEEKRRELEQASPCDPLNSRFYKQFKEAIWNVHHSGEPMPGQELEDIVMTTSEFGLKNHTCPISGKPVTELVDPVRSSACQHIFERSAVMEHIRMAGRRICPCAIAGCPKPLRVAELICDEYLQVEITELRARSCEGAQSGAQDFTDLDAVVDLDVVEDTQEEEE